MSWKRRSWTGHSAFAFYRAHERCFLTADESSCAEINVQLKIEAGIKNILAKQPCLCCLVYGQPQPFDSKGIFRPHINVPVIGTYGPCTDNHSLDDRVRV